MKWLYGVMVIVVCLVPLAGADDGNEKQGNASFYQWRDEKGNMQYSNTIPASQHDRPAHVTSVDNAQQLSWEGSFQRVVAKDGPAVSDEEWAQRFKEFNVSAPELPVVDMEASEKVKKILADVTIMLDNERSRYKQYCVSYEKRKAEVAQELEEHKAEIEAKTWRPMTIIEPEADFLKKKETYEKNIKYYELLQKWASQKKRELL